MMLAVLFQSVTVALGESPDAFRDTGVGYLPVGGWVIYAG